MKLAIALLILVGVSWLVIHNREQLREWWPGWKQNLLNVGGLLATTFAAVLDYLQKVDLGAFFSDPQHLIIAGVTVFTLGTLASLLTKRAET